MDMQYNIADLFECVADHVPGREAVVSGDRRLTFAGLVALVHHRDLTPRVVPIVAGAPRLRLLVEVDDGLGDVSASDAIAYEELLSVASAERDFGPRSGDDRYLLYTGGTTGLPRGVVWRQEDIFFAALGSGNPGGPPIT